MACYCPSIGLCEIYAYTVQLDGIILNDTHEGDHNREYHFTFEVMNEAHLTTIERVSGSSLHSLAACCNMLKCMTECILT